MGMFTVGSPRRHASRAARRPRDGIKPHGGSQEKNAAPR